MSFDLRADLRKFLFRQHLAVAEHRWPGRPRFPAAGCCPASHRPPAWRARWPRSPCRRRRGSAVREPRHEVLTSWLDVVAAVAQRRHEDRKDVQPVVEVLAELAVLDLLQEVAVRRRDQADVDLDGRARADRVDLAVLHGAQELDLHLVRQVADLVEEQRARMRLDELAGVLFGGAGERALLVAEQDAFDQIVGDGAAIDRRRTASPRAVAASPGWRARPAPCRRRIRPRSGSGCWTPPPSGRAG